jgi:hypothetical protein
MILLIGSAAFFPLIEVIGKQVVRARLPGCGKKILRCKFVDASIVGCV